MDCGDNDRTAPRVAALQLCVASVDSLPSSAQKNTVHICQWTTLHPPDAYHLARTTDGFRSSPIPTPASRWFTVVVTMGAADGDVSGACDSSMAGCDGRLWEFVTQSTKNVPGSNLPADPSRRGSGCREAAHGSHPLHKSARSPRRCPPCHQPPAAPGSATPVCPQPRQVLCGHTGGRQRTSAFVYGPAPTAAP